MDEKELALEAIRKKLVGKKLTYKEVYAVMDEIAHDRLGEILTTYFVASGYSKGFTDEELYYLTRAMVETGEHLKFSGVVADKHSIGGTPGGRMTMVVVPIIAAAGFKIPKSSSRAITTPAGTADAMETLASVTFTEKEIYELIEKTNACIVWGGSFRIAPADDEIIRIEEPLLFESFDKVLVSVMAKKIAFGSTHIIIDVPYGATVKVHSVEDAKVLEKKFLYLARKFNKRLQVYAHEVEEPAGRGIGPLLEARDALQVLEQRNHRPLALEERSLKLAGMLLDLCLQDANQDQKKKFKQGGYKNGHEWAKDILSSGSALQKMKEIIEAQKGDPLISSDKLIPAPEQKDVISHESGVIKKIDNKNITIIAKLLGAPENHAAGLDLYKRIGEKIENNESIMRFYSDSKYKLKEALDSLPHFPVYEVR